MLTKQSLGALFAVDLALAVFAKSGADAFLAAVTLLEVLTDGRSSAVLAAGSHLPYLTSREKI